MFLLFTNWCSQWTYNIHTKSCWYVDNLMCIRTLNIQFFFLSKNLFVQLVFIKINCLVAYVLQKSWTLSVYWVTCGCLSTVPKTCTTKASSPSTSSNASFASSPTSSRLCSRQNNGHPPRTWSILWNGVGKLLVIRALTFNVATMAVSNSL